MLIDSQGCRELEPEELHTTKTFHQLKDLDLSFESFMLNSYYYLSHRLHLI